VDRGAWLDEGIASYKTFISGLLDVTDNLVAGEAVAPPRVVRHDEDDTYLVVAADKGTAKFSDIANGKSAEYGFWLDDAFASGGSAGYDHKGMGITARGAWESVKRHFREMGIDCQSEDFTAVGIGDMSGDVFGNGMLLSEHIRLVAAFDHRHIFVDPDPDIATSYAERRRLFDLGGSSWKDYDASKISSGGGVFDRSAKSVPVTPEMRRALDLDESVEAVTPAELMKSILLAPVDLLWNGGIGTYVKSAGESNSEIGDRANDAIRVNGSDLRCKVIGEGGNLGMSQLGRIEAALGGVHVNTDAIDNSAGVDTSDHEVNIKILLTGLTKSGELIMESRNELLASMTDEVAEQVLRDNYEQNVLLGNARAQQHGMLTVHERLLHFLEEHGDLDRALEFLPGDAEIQRRNKEGLGLVSPEFAVLVAYAKLYLKDQLIGSSLPDDPWFESTLREYFPEPLRERYADEIAAHPLRREIITNAVANSMVNRGGITFAYRALEETGADPEQVARAYVVCREVFDLAGFVRAVEATDNLVSTQSQTASSAGCSTVRCAGSSRRVRPGSTSLRRSRGSARASRAWPAGCPTSCTAPSTSASCGGCARSRRTACRASSPSRWPRCSTCSPCSTASSSPRSSARNSGTSWACTSSSPRRSPSTPCWAGSPRCPGRTAGMPWRAARSATTCMPCWAA
jgi:glutamate dehydrogenase